MNFISLLQNQSQEKRVAVQFEKRGGAGNILVMKYSDETKIHPFIYFNAQSP